ncbi:hypothetical protein [Mycobacteroides franklinii]|uniref:Integral membrane protein n=1 Tax=Mycobacteroides franklinii TaxID=948102 RepID=A0A4R8RAL9_9MYCO|nr:hypothetical protein [Mycobacteroides franklinii]TDZ44356.1 hypothetical protein CCUG64054_04421 [Mycobacteroides franklinii]TDZ51489.1 hypothetical protein CCUG63697_03005 [Mycobacteroides franklinii]TDZ57910.1 hypothetical protein CCUG63696_04417 [Mycobacteroides franklinii]TDZ64851.1 hypothetical protein CCUG63695_04347 [Mycobacteroides franklinii]TDZ71249.1 hypothetical protein CCUG64056_04421 [Mycobacteroides franklinii]
MTKVTTTGYVVSSDTAVTLLAAGLIFLLSLLLGVWKYRQMVTSPNHLAHPYVDTAHRAALLYSFATLLTAVFVELSAWPSWVNLTAAMVLVFFFVAAIASYIAHGALRDTTNQFEKPSAGMYLAMVLLILGEVGGFGVLLTGFVRAQWFS